MKPALILLLTVPFLFAAVFAIRGPLKARQVRAAAEEQARAQVHRIVEDLDRRTTESGVYVRVKEDDIQELDPWGRRLQVLYSQGGVAETIVVRSAGADGKFHTMDDVESQAMSANLKGIGKGIQAGAEQTAHNVAKGAVKGTVAGIKETVKESLHWGKAK